MNFFEEFFDLLVNIEAKNLIKKEKPKIEEIKEKKKEEEKIEKLEDESLKKIKREPLIIRKFPPTFDIGKITAKELIPKKEFIPSLELIKEIPVERKIERFNFGKINDIVYNTDVQQVKIINDEKIIVIYKNGKSEEKDIIMNKDEILELLNKISKITKIPLDKEFGCYFEDFFIEAKFNEKILVNIRRII
ncbi:MAG: hypothetical protein QXQ30_01990 [Candidatus Pacearchaeota archaeon]